MSPGEKIFTKVERSVTTKDKTDGRDGEMARRLGCVGGPSAKIGWRESAEGGAGIRGCRPDRAKSEPERE